MKTAIFVNITFMVVLAVAFAMVGFGTIVSLNKLFPLDIAIDAYSISSASFLWLMLHLCVASASPKQLQQS